MTTASTALGAVLLVIATALIAFCALSDFFSVPSAPARLRARPLVLLPLAFGALLLAGVLLRTP